MSSRRPPDSVIRYILSHKIKADVRPEMPGETAKMRGDAMSIEMPVRRRPLAATALAAAITATAAGQLCISVSSAATLPPEDMPIESRPEGLPQARALTEEGRKLFDSWDGNPYKLRVLKLANDKIQAAARADPAYAPIHVQCARNNLFRAYVYRDVDPRYARDSLEYGEFDIRLALRLDPTLADAYVVLANIKLVEGKTKDAVTALDKAEQLGSTNAWLPLLRGLIQTYAGHPDQAAPLYEKGLQQAQTQQDQRAIQAASYGLWNYYAERGDRAAMERYFRIDGELRPDDVALQTAYAAVLMRDFGDFDAGEQIMRRVMQRSQSDPVKETLAIALYGRWARLASTKADGAAAKRYLEEARALQPDLEKVEDFASHSHAAKFIVDALKASGAVS
jgi:tetratricopeptide (TPR) repeat protein